jgi:two-component system, cell cycle response regulator
MARRILVAEESKHLVTALRRGLDGTGFIVEAVSRAEAVRRLDPDRHVAAIVRGDDAARAVVDGLRAADRLLPVIALFADAEEAALHPGAFGADGVLVGPLSGPAVAGACTMAEKLGTERRRVVALEAAAAERARGGEAGLDFVNKLLLLEVKRSKRYGYPVAVAVVGVDRWGDVQAALDRPARAALVAEVLALLTASVRDIDLVAPFAEERFVVLMPHTGAGGALNVARRLVGKLRDRKASHRTTASAGIAGHDGGGTISYGLLVKRAAGALTKARAEGGDRAVAAEPLPERDRSVAG